MRKVRVGTRGSPLALSQATMLATDIAAAGGFDFEIVPIKSEGDIRKEPLIQFGGVGVFVHRLRETLLSGEVDIIIHSLKDLPTADFPGIGIATISQRADPRDALCARNGLTLQELPEGAVIGTGSPRRACQIYQVRPDVHVVGIRGNIDTRLTYVEEKIDAVVLSYAGLCRLNKEMMASQVLSIEDFLPAPGQAALAVEAREELLHHDDQFSQALMAGLIACDDMTTRAAVTAERAVLSATESGCSAPLGAYAHIKENGEFTLSAVLFSEENKKFHHTLTTTLPAKENIFAAVTEYGSQVAEKLLAQY